MKGHIHCRLVNITSAYMKDPMGPRKCTDHTMTYEAYCRPTTPRDDAQQLPIETVDSLCLPIPSHDDTVTRHEILESLSLPHHLQ